MKPQYPKHNWVNPDNSTLVAVLDGWDLYLERGSYFLVGDEPKKSDWITSGSYMTKPSPHASVPEDILEQAYAIINLHS